MQYTLEVLKPTLVKLTSNHIRQLLGMIAWGVGAIPFNMQTKLECDEDFTLVIRTRYAKALGWSMTKSLHQIRHCDVKRLASLRNTIIYK